MTAPAQPRPPAMTADAFLEWASRTGFRGELVAGKVVAMSPESYDHGRVKGDAFIARGNTRPLLPTKMSCPSPCAQSRVAAGGNAASAGRSQSAAAP